MVARRKRTEAAFLRGSGPSQPTASRIAPITSTLAKQRAWAAQYRLNNCQPRDSDRWRMAGRSMGYCRGHPALFGERPVSLRFFAYQTVPDARLCQEVTRPLGVSLDLLA